jgi:diguanylate cyclase (GGDEF)-like protein
LAVVVACIAAPYGGGFALTLVALVWCGLRYSVFATAALTLLASIWTLGGISLGLVSGWPESDITTVGAQLGVMLAGLTPLTVASVMAAHNGLRERFEQITSRDLLSGLLSRHAFVEHSEQLLAEAGRAQVPVAVLMLDIDHFKKINHTHGLGAGDRMIITLAGVVTTSLSDADVIGRLGGEEFAALLPGATPAEATAAAERIRHAFAATPTDLGNGGQVEATLSIGIGCAASAPSSIEPLLQVADEALSLAKGGGRNRIVRRDVVTQRPASPVPGATGFPARST